MSAPHTVAILGAGIGAEHLVAYEALPGRFRVVVLCDQDTARARAVVAGRDIRVETSLDAVLADPEITIIDNCLPPALHVPVSIAAMEAGKHVVCEKPIAPSLAEADRLLSTAGRTGRVFSPVFQYRYGIGMAQLDAVIAAGLAGAPYAATLETHWNRDAAYYANPWRGAWSGEGGGAVLSHAIHIHDLMCHVLGPVESLSAMLSTRVNPIEVEDCAALAFRMESGAVVTSSITLGAADDRSRLRFCFEGVTVESRGSAYAPCALPWSFTAREPVTQDRIDAVLAAVEPPNAGFTGFFAALADRLSGGAHHAVTGADGRRALELVAATYHAGRTGAAVRLPLAPGHPCYDNWRPAAPDEA